MKLVCMCLGAGKRGSVWFWGWDSKLGPCWDPFLPRQLQPFSKFGWEGKKGKVLYTSWSNAFSEQGYRVLQKNVPRFSTRICLGGDDHRPRRKRRLGEHCSFGKVLIILLPRQSRRETGWETGWVWSCSQPHHCYSRRALERQGKIQFGGLRV